MLYLKLFYNFAHTIRLLLNRNNYLKQNKLFILDKNTWNHATVWKLFVLGILDIQLCAKNT